MFTKELLASLVLAGTLAGAAHAQPQQQTTQEGVNYATGGVTVEELEQMRSEKDQYSLWLTTAAKGSGAYLSDADVTIANAKTGEEVLDTTVEGPWLFVNLPAGEYQVIAKYNDQVQTRKIRIGAKSHQHAVIYFNSQADVSPDWVSPFPKGGPTASNP